MWVRLAVVLVLAVLLAGCGDDGTVPVTTTTVATATTTAAIPGPGLAWARVPDDEVVFGGQGDQVIWSVTAGGPGLVAAGHSGPGATSGENWGAVVWVSADGYTWTRIDDEAVFGGPGHPSISSVTAGGPGLVAVGWDASAGQASPGGGSDGAVWVSADGYTWTRIPDDEAVFGGLGDQIPLSVTVGGPGLVAAGWERTIAMDIEPDVEPEFDAAVWVSADGYTWTRIDDEAVFGGPGDQQINSVTAGRPGLVATGWNRSEDDTDGLVWVSADGDSWTRIDDEAIFGGPGGQLIWSVTAGGPGLIAAGYETSGDDWDAAVWVSADGYTWTRVPHDEAVFGGPGNQVIRSVTAGGPGLVAAGHSGPGGATDVAAVWVSADGYTWTRVHDEVISAGSAARGSGR